MIHFNPWRFAQQFFGARLSPVPREYWQIAQQARARANEIRGQSPEHFRQAAQQLRGTASAQLALSYYYEALRRIHGIEAHDEQLIAAWAMSQGQIVEMATGEGKTLTALAVAALWGLLGRHVHVVAPNAYLAERDAEVAAPVLKLLGLHCSYLPEGGPPEAKQQAYRQEIVYGTGYEFCFDFLRDELTSRNYAQLPLGQKCLGQLTASLPAAPQRIQSEHDCAIVDEVDSVLIDEACMPLVISQCGSGEDLGAGPQLARQLVIELVLGQDFALAGGEQKPLLTQAGERRVQQSLARAANVRLARPWPILIQQALHAEWSLRRDVDYVVRQEKVQIVDQQTGRIFPDRTWQDGLHQAVEAKEGLAIRPEHGSDARISRQRYFRLYKTVCGLTGTVVGVETEFWQQQRLATVAIPLRRPCRRQMLPDRWFANEEDKLNAIVHEIATIAKSGRPILVGTRTIESSLKISSLLAARGQNHLVLNGLQDEDEAAVVARAGEREAVTIATNMAGRGTDIRLGAGVADLGGLHVIGVERHESRRVDRQLAGRAARQGDPGSCRFFISADDLLITQHGGSLHLQMRQTPDRDGELLRGFAAGVTAAQKRAESAARDSRRQLLAHDEWSQSLLKSLQRS